MKASCLLDVKNVLVNQSAALSELDHVFTFCVTSTVRTINIKTQMAVHVMILSTCIHGLRVQ